MGGAHKSHNSHVGGGSRTARRRSTSPGVGARRFHYKPEAGRARDAGGLGSEGVEHPVLPEQAWARQSPAACSRPVGLPHVAGLLFFGSWRWYPLPPSSSQAGQCLPLGLRSKGGPSSGEDATPTALIALIPRRGKQWGCWGRGPGAADWGSSQAMPTWGSGLGSGQAVQSQRAE